MDDLILKDKQWKSKSSDGALQAGEFKPNTRRSQSLGLIVSRLSIFLKLSLYFPSSSISICGHELLHFFCPKFNGGMQ